jgi:hypothetical protein
MKRSNLIINEKKLRKIIKEAPTETNTIGLINDVRKKYSNKNLEEQILDGTFNEMQSLDFYFRGLIIGPGATIRNFLNDLLSAMGLPAASPANMIDIVNKLIDAVGGKKYNKKLTEGDMDKLSAGLWGATEGGITGLGTYKTEIGEALGSGPNSPVGKNFSQSLDAYYLNKRYKTYADSKGTELFTARQYPGADLRNTLYGEFDDGKETANIQKYVLQQLVAKHYFSFESALENEKGDKNVNINLENIFEEITFLAMQKIDAASTAKKDSTSTIPGDSSKTTTKKTTSTSPSSPSASVKVSTSTKKPSRERITTTDLLASIPRKLKDGTTGFKFEDIFDINTFREGLISNLNIENSGFRREHRYQFEISFKKGNSDDLVEIDMNTSPIGTHRIVMAGKLLKKAIKGKKWDGSLKKIVGQSLNDAAQQKETKYIDLKGLKRFRFTIVIPPGDYTLNENKIIIKGKNLLNIISKF